MTFDISDLPEGITVTSVRIDSVRHSHVSSFNFAIYAANNYGTLSAGDFNSFPGWNSGMSPYSNTRYSDLIENGDILWNLNSAGKSYIQSNTNGEVYFVMMDVDDYNGNNVQISNGGHYNNYFTSSYTFLNVVHSGGEDSFDCLNCGRVTSIGTTQSQARDPV